MAHEYFDFSPCLEIWPTRIGEGVAKDWKQEQYDAIKQVELSLSDYARWTNGIWSATKSISGYYRTCTCSLDPETVGKCDPNCEDSCSCCQRAEHTQAAGIRKIFDGGNADRINKCPKSDETWPVPSYSEATCPDFGSLPSRYGKIPEEDRNKTRYNVCFGNGSTTYFQLTYQRRDQGPQERCCCDGNSGCPPPIESIQAGSTNADNRNYQTGACGTCSCGGDPERKISLKCYYGSCRVRFYSQDSISIYGGYFNTQTGKVHPKINMSGIYPSYGFTYQGYLLDSQAKGQNGKFNSTTTITVAGKKLNYVGTSALVYGPTPPGSARHGCAGQIGLSVTFDLKERPL